MLHHKSLKIKANSYKIGLDEVEGLKDAMNRALHPIVDSLQDRVYWSSVAPIEAEYKSRDGFLAHSHNCGGLIIQEIIPECESRLFSFLEFGEWDGTHYCSNPDIGDCECCLAQDNEYDASLCIWFKFEGFNNGMMQFYLVVSGGHNDAPYYREQYMPTLFESSFEAKTIKEFERKAKSHINKLLKFINPTK